MRANAVEVAVGFGVIAVTVWFAFVLLSANGFGAGQTDGQFYLTASFRSAEGIDVGTEVRMSGVKVGSVTDLSLNPQSYRADTIIQINGNVDVPNDSTAVVASEGLLGGNYVELMPGGALDYYRDGDEIQDTQGAVSLINMLMRFVGGDN